MPCATRLTIVILLALFLSVGLMGRVSAESLHGGSTVPAARRSHTAKNGVPPKTVEQTGGLRLLAQQTGTCHVLAPKGWSLTTNPQGSTCELFAPDRSLYAGWGVLSVDRAMQPFYGGLYGDPETSMQTLAIMKWGFATTNEIKDLRSSFIAGALILQSLGDASGLRYTSPPRPCGEAFLQRSFVSAHKQGILIYRIYPTVGANYIESVYSAITDQQLWKTHGATVTSIAASIRGTTRLQPPRSSGAPPTRPGGTRGEEAGDSSPYNAQLGTEYVHSPATGENFLVDPSTSYNETGPQGPGYYQQVGTDYEKLEMGRSAE